MEIDKLKITSLISDLDKNWFEWQRVVFILHCIDQGITPANTTVLTQLPDFCWNSEINFNDSVTGAEKRDNFGYNGQTIAGKIILNIRVFVNELTDLKSKWFVIEKAIEEVKRAIDNVKQTHSNVYHHLALDNFSAKTEEEIVNTFKHLKEEIDFVNSLGLIERKLTVKICLEIANLRINNKKFITSVEGMDNAGEALYRTLIKDSKKQTGLEPPRIKIRIEDWSNQDVHYMLYRLTHLSTDKINIVEIQKKKALLLKKGNYFTANAFGKFKSGTLQKYVDRNPNASIIDHQLASISFR